MSCLQSITCVLLASAALLVTQSGCPRSLRGSPPPNLDPGLSRSAGAPVYVRAGNSAAYLHYIRADSLFLEGRYAAALAELRIASAHDPGSTYLLTRIAECHAHLRDYRKAMRLLDKAVKLDPHRPHAYVLRGRLLIAAGEDTDAVENLEAALRIDARLEEAYTLLAGVYLARFDAASARRVYGEMAEAFPEQYMPHVRLADIALDAGELTAAETHLKEVIARAPHASEAVRLLGELQERRGSRKDAIALYEEATVDRFPPPDLRMRLIRLYLAEGRDSEAEAEARLLQEEAASRLDEAARLLSSGRIFLDGGRPAAAARMFAASAALEDVGGEASFHLGRALADAGDLDGALRAWGEVPLGAERDDDARAEEVRVLARSGELEAALARVEDATSRCPSCSSLVEARAWVILHGGNPAEAIAYLQAAIDGEPSNERLRYAFGLILAESGDLERAVAAMRDVLELNPKHSRAMSFIGATYARLGLRLSEAEALVKRALALEPTAGTIAGSLGLIYLKMGRLGDALLFLEEASRMAPYEAEIFDHLGDVLVAEHETERAREAYERALGLVSDEEDRETIADKLRALHRDVPE